MRNAIRPGRRLVLIVFAAGAVGLIAPAGALADGIGGTVTAADGVTPVPSFEVEVYETGSDHLEANGCTNASGVWDLGASPGNYYVHFSGDGSACGTPSTFAPEWYNNFFQKANATPVFVADGAPTTGINASLVDGARIAGTVTNQSGGATLQNVTVELLNSSGNLMRSACTAADGTYALDPAAPLPYMVKFSSTGTCGNPGNFAPQWYDGSSTQAGATLVAPSVGEELTGIDAVMVPAPLIDLTVVTNGTGTGTVTSNLGGISCPPTCIASLPQGTPVTLTPASGPGSIFTGWSGGACTGFATCDVILNANTSATATFDLGGGVVHGLTVQKTGSGSGVISSSPAGIDCGDDCFHAYPDGLSVTLTATPGSGSTFAGWSGGGCSGTGPCTLAMTATRDVTAGFGVPSTPSPLPPAGGDSPPPPSGGDAAACDDAKGALATAEGKLKKAKKKLKKAKRSGVAAKIKRAKATVRKAKAAVMKAQAAVDAAC